MLLQPERRVEVRLIETFQGVPLYSKRRRANLNSSSIYNGSSRSANSSVMDSYDLVSNLNLERSKYNPQKQYQYSGSASNVGNQRYTNHNRNSSASDLHELSLG